MEANPYAELLGKLGSGYVDAYLRNAERYARFVGNVFKSGGRPVEAGVARQRYENFVRVEGPKVLGQVSEAGLNYYRLVLECGVGAMDRFVEQVLGPADAAASTAAAPAPAPTILFSGQRGEQPSNAFVIANHRDEPVDVSFEVAELVSDDGASKFRPAVRFTPASLRLAPHLEQVIQCAVVLSDDYRVGVAHRGQIQVVGFPEMTLRMSVQVEAAPPAVAAAPAAAPAAKPAPKARAKTAAKRTPAR